MSLGMLRASAKAHGPSAKLRGCASHPGLQASEGSDGVSFQLRFLQLPPTLSCHVQPLGDPIWGTRAKVSDQA